MRELQPSALPAGAADPRRSVRRSARASVAVTGLLLAIAIWVAAPAPNAALVGLGLFGLIAAIVLSRIEAFHPFADFGPANRITLVRAMLACLLAAFVAAEVLVFSVGVLTIALAALALDGLDGWVARRSATTSRFGARFDMEIDALLILVLSIAVWLGGKAAAWVLLLGLMRYGLVVASLVWPWLARDLPASMRRKAICVLQVAVLSLLLLPWVVPPLSTALAAMALATLAWSFAVDIAWLARQRNAA